MRGLELVIGNKKYSSWSFRPWLLLKEAQIPFREIRIPIRQKNSERRILRYSPAGRVPVLRDGSLTIWESLAICEYLAEAFPQKQLWPRNPEARAEARSISHEMHAGFSALRQNLPCHFVARYKRFVIPNEAKGDLSRIQAIWTGAKTRWGKGGPFLFGSFSIADAMFAPVVFRFLAYGVRTNVLCREYMNHIENLDSTREWVEAARWEREVITAYELKIPQVT